MQRLTRFVLWGGLTVGAAVGLAWLALSSLMPDGTEALAEGDFDVSVRYVTTRARDDSRDPGAFYGGERGAVDQGYCTVRFRPIPGADEFAAELSFHVPTALRSVIATNPSAPNEFWNALDEELAAAPERRIVLFVHGYAYGYGRACRMGAALTQLLGDATTVVMFTWPSDANPVEYVADQVDVEWSVPARASLIAALNERYGLERLSVLAHSLGTRGTLQALHRLRAEAASGEPLVEQLVLLAPDFDQESFVDLHPMLEPLVRDWTLYASSHDAPLALSATLHGHPRLGQAGDALTVLSGVTTIDVSPVGRYQITGHEYHYYHPIVASDLALLLTEGQAVANRPGMRRQAEGDRVWWSLDP